MSPPSNLHLLTRPTFGLPSLPKRAKSFLVVGFDAGANDVAVAARHAATERLRSFMVIG